MHNQVDCVVVGAGNGGLVAALQLAREGLRPLLIEQHNVPGGFATSFVRGRFEFEVSVHEITALDPSAKPGSLRYLLENELGVYLDWAPVPEAYRLILTDPASPLDVCVPFGMQACIDAVAEAVPGSREAVTRYLHLFDAVRQAFAAVTEAKGKVSPLRMLLQHRDFVRTAGYTLQEVADAMDVPKAAQDILHAYWCYLGPPAQRVSFPMFAMMTASYLENGAHVPRLRAHALSSALAARVEELGGTIRYGTRVERIVIRNRRVVGVDLSDGTQLECQHVISNASPELVYGKLMHPRSEVPAEAHQLGNARVRGLSGFVVFLGLDASPDALGLDNYGYFIGDDMDTRRVYDSMAIPDEPDMLAAICLNRAVPDCSPENTTVLSLTTLFQEKAWAGVSAEDYFAVKNRIAAKMIERTERATGAPIRAHIEEIAVATPATMHRYTGAYNGLIYGYEPEPWDSALTRMPTRATETFVDGLAFCGGFASIGHGYYATLQSGMLAASTTVDQIKTAQRGAA